MPSEVAYVTATSALLDPVRVTVSSTAPPSVPATSATDSTGGSSLSSTVPAASIVPTVACRGADSDSAKVSFGSSTASSTSSTAIVPDIRVGASVSTPSAAS